MNDIICKINNDSSYMVMVAIAIVILLFVVLMVVISSMRIKSYKDRFINTEIDNHEKEALIIKLQKELQDLKIRNAQNEQELQQFAQTREKLSDTESKLEHLQTSNNALEKLQSETRSELDHTLNIFGKLTEEHKTLNEKFEAVQEDNNKLHVNNARLLMKLESEARFASEMEKRSKGDDS